MAEATVPVDLRNPGQVFACMGLMEAAEVLCGPCEGSFGYEGLETATTFTLVVPGKADPTEEVLSFLRRAVVRELAPIDWSPTLKRRKGESDGKFEHRKAAFDRWLKGLERSTGFPGPRPESPATLPALLTDSTNRIVIDYWSDGSTRDNVKFWGGAGGYSGSDLARDALKLVRNAAELDKTCLFEASAPQSSSFRFDWRRDYIPIDVGFSPNEHGNIVMAGYPIVELLAAIGMSHGRPQPIDKLAYRYGVSSIRLPSLFARAVLGGQGLGFPIRLFRMQLGWPSKEGQARCIIDAQEEFT